MEGMAGSSSSSDVTLTLSPHVARLSLPLGISTFLPFWSQASSIHVGKGPGLHGTA